MGEKKSYQIKRIIKAGSASKPHSGLNALPKYYRSYFIFPFRVLSESYDLGIVIIQAFVILRKEFSNFTHFFILLKIFVWLFQTGILNITDSFHIKA